MSLNLFCELLIKACKSLIPFLSSDLKVTCPCVYFINLLPLLSVDIFILAIFIRFQGYRGLHNDARRDRSLEDTVNDITKFNSLAKIKNIHANRLDKTP